MNGRGKPASHTKVMPLIANQNLGLFTCPICVMTFARSAANQKYCGPRCRQKAERRRAAERQPVRAENATVSGTVLMSLTKPTLAEMTAAADALTLPIFKDKVVQVAGPLPEGWLAPETVYFNDNGDGTFTMTHKATDSAFDAWLAGGCTGEMPPAGGSDIAKKTE